MSTSGPKSFFGNVMAQDIETVTRFIRANPHDRLVLYALKMAQAQGGRLTPAQSHELAGEIARRNKELHSVAQEGLAAQAPPAKIAPRPDTHYIEIEFLDATAGDVPLPDVHFQLDSDPLFSGEKGRRRRDDIEPAAFDLHARASDQLFIEQVVWEPRGPIAQQPPHSGSLYLIHDVVAHQVQKGETLQGIAGKYAIPGEVLAQFNWGAEGLAAYRKSLETAPSAVQVAELARILYRRVGAIDWLPVLPEGQRNATSEHLTFSGEETPGIVYVPVLEKKPIRAGLTTWPKGRTDRHSLRVRRFKWPALEQNFAVTVRCSHCGKAPKDQEEPPRNRAKPFWVSALEKGVRPTGPKAPVFLDAPRRALQIVPSSESAADTITLALRSTEHPPPRMLPVRPFRNGIFIADPQGHPSVLFTEKRTPTAGGKVAVGDECTYTFEAAFPKDHPVYGPKKAVTDALQVAMEKQGGTFHTVDFEKLAASFPNLVTKYGKIALHFLALYEGKSPYSYVVDVPGLGEPVEVELFYPHSWGVEYEKEAWGSYSAGALRSYNDRGGLKKKLKTPWPTGHESWQAEAAKAGWVWQESSSKFGDKETAYDRNDEEANNAKAVSEAVAAEDAHDEAIANRREVEARRESAVARKQNATAALDTLERSWRSEEASYTEMAANLKSQGVGHWRDAEKQLEARRSAYQERRTALLREQDEAAQELEAAQNGADWAHAAVESAEKTRVPARDAAVRQHDAFQVSKAEDVPEEDPNAPPPPPPKPADPTKGRYEEDGQMDALARRTKATAKRIDKLSLPLTFKLDGAPVELNPLKFIGSTLSFVSNLVGLIQTIRDYVPSVGFYFDLELKILEGTIGVELGWTERREPRLLTAAEPEMPPYDATLWFGAAAKVTIFKIKAEVGFGLKWGSAVKACAFFAVSGEISLDLSFKTKAARPISLGPLIGKLECELGVMAEAGKYVEMKAALKSGFSANLFLELGTGAFATAASYVDADVSAKFKLDQVKFRLKLDWEGVKADYYISVSIGGVLGCDAGGHDVQIVEPMTLKELEFPSVEEYAPESLTVDQITEILKQAIRGFWGDVSVERSEWARDRIAHEVVKEIARRPECSLHPKDLKDTIYNIAAFLRGYGGKKGALRTDDFRHALAELPADAVILHAWRKVPLNGIQAVVVAAIQQRLSVWHQDQSTTAMQIAKKIFDTPRAALDPDSVTATVDKVMGLLGGRGQFTRDGLQAELDGAAFGARVLKHGEVELNIPDAQKAVQDGLSGITVHSMEDVADLAGYMAEKIVATPFARLDEKTVKATAVAINQYIRSDESGFAGAFQSKREGKYVIKTGEDVFKEWVDSPSFKGLIPIDPAKEYQELLAKKVAAK
jgi:hypothetical protein